ncbi:MAG: hypothetical protein EOP88_12570 [Verrucomicrobiaceae bacterium]|nr:MAG: hypothetical protein EOP88_12570 [Verrucomicrobiaceae bacterium]
MTISKFISIMPGQPIVRLKILALALGCCLIPVVSHGQAIEPPLPDSDYAQPGSGALPMTGGYAVQIRLPDRIEELKWEQDKFDLSFTVLWDLKGKMTAVVRIENDPAENQPWKLPFEKAFKDALMMWQWKPTLTRSGRALPAGTPIHIKLQKNAKGDTNIEIDDGGGIIVKTNPRFTM